MALASHPGIYDTIGRRYAAQRRPDPRIAAQIVARLADDIASGAWARRNAELLERDEMDLGYRLIIAG